MNESRCEGCGCNLLLRPEGSRTIPASKDFPELLVCVECEALDQTESSPEALKISHQLTVESI